MKVEGAVKGRHITDMPKLAAFIRLSVVLIDPKQLRQENVAFSMYTFESA